MISKKASREYQLPRKVEILETKKMQTKFPGLYREDMLATKIMLAQLRKCKMRKIRQTV
jgi:hypothetical protein